MVVTRKQVRKHPGRCPVFSGPSPSKGLSIVRLQQSPTNGIDLSKSWVADFPLVAECPHVCANCGESDFMAHLSQLVPKSANNLGPHTVTRARHVEGRIEVSSQQKSRPPNTMTETAHRS